MAEGGNTLTEDRRGLFVRLSIAFSLVVIPGRRGTRVGLVIAFSDWSGLGFAGVFICAGAGDTA